MKKRLISMLLALVMVLGMLPVTALAVGSEEEALGEVNIYNGEQKLSYLSINGRIRELIYTYFNHVDANGRTKEIPAYCVNPNTTGVPQTVGPGESIKYIAKEKGNDPKVMGIIANGYPTRGLSELKLENKYHAYYATKMALWCYLLPNWNINNLKVNPNLTGAELQRAQAILAAAKDIYVRGTAWNKIYSPRVTAAPDRDTAYAVTVDGQQYKQQVFTVHSDTWVCNYAIRVAFSDPASVPAGARIVDMNNKDITTITTSGTGDGYGGKFKVLYPAAAVAGKTGSVQLSFTTDVYKYAVFYAVCAEQNKYGKLQNYMCDTDPTVTMRLSAYSNYSDGGEVEPPDTGLKITKLEKGTDTPLGGAIFEVVDPDGATVGTFATGSDGTVTIPLTLAGNYTVYERVAPLDHLLSDTPAQNIRVEYGKVAELTCWNEPYGTLRIEKLSDTGAHLPGAMVQIKHIESGVTYTAETNFAGYAIFDNIKPGAYEIKEITAPSGWLKDDATYTASVATGETTTFSLVNKELPGLRIIKYDRKNMVAMPNVTFEIFRDSVSLGKFRTDEFGEILLTDAAPGTYRAVEVDTGSDGHILDTTPQEVELSAGDGIKELLFFNDVKPGMRLIKVDSTDPSKVIPNAVFEIKSVAGDYGPKEFTTDQNGEIIEIITGSENRGPSRDWLNIVKTSEAKNKIRNWFKKERREENIQEGRDALEREMRRNLMTLTDEQHDVFMEALARRNRCNSVEEMYAAIGYGGLQISRMLPKLKEEYTKLQATEPKPVTVELKRMHSSDGVIVEGIDNCPIKFAKCCSPLPGDEIIGFVTRGFGVSIHKRDCANARESMRHPENADRWVRAYWDEAEKENYKATLDIVCIDRANLVSDVALALGDMRVPIYSLTARAAEQGRARMSVTVGITNTEHLNSVVARLKKIKDVVSVTRN